MHPQWTQGVCLKQPQALVTLRTQYRMARGIQDLANHLVYNGRLRAGSAAVEAAALEVQPPATAVQPQQYPPWLQQVRAGLPLHAPPPRHATADLHACRPGGAAAVRGHAAAATCPGWSRHALLPEGRYSG